MHRLALLLRQRCASSRVLSRGVRSVKLIRLAANPAADAEYFQAQAAARLAEAAPPVPSSSVNRVSYASLKELHGSSSGALTSDIRLGEAVSAAAVDCVRQARHSAALALIESGLSDRCFHEVDFARLIKGAARSKSAQFIRALAALLEDEAASEPTLAKAGRLCALAEEYRQRGGDRGAAYAPLVAALSVLRAVEEAAAAAAATAASVPPPRAPAAVLQRVFAAVLPDLDALAAAAATASAGGGGRSSGGGNPLHAAVAAVLERMGGSLDPFLADSLIEAGAAAATWEAHWGPRAEGDKEPGVQGVRGGPAGGAIEGVAAGGAAAKGGTGAATSGGSAEGVTVAAIGVGGRSDPASEYGGAAYAVAAFDRALAHPAAPQLPSARAAAALACSLIDARLASRAQSRWLAWLEATTTTRRGRQQQQQRRQPPPLTPLALHWIGVAAQALARDAAARQDPAAAAALSLGLVRWAEAAAAAGGPASAAAGGVAASSSSSSSWQLLAHPALVAALCLALRASGVAADSLATHLRVHPASPAVQAARLSQRMPVEDVVLLGGTRLVDAQARGGEEDGGAGVLLLLRAA